MVHSPPFWVKAWFIISTILVFWDAGYCLLRPHTFEGGKYHTLWTPYVLYASVDYLYGHAVFKAGEGFTSAQAILNVVENFMNITYLLLLRAGSANAILVGFFAVTCTFWKTASFWGGSEHGSPSKPAEFDDALIGKLSS
ncbi:hypothetical protein MVLG_03783 [Microbotryum lychnidis-dioicae p1A1 Lamole]|uniref:Uncharacterized protein n=1 Tax=Microbotryum lychnidis-dioicae (strain p1A1 Lamole / MvSl-1064) TaxID=683840 RepID=U5H990_USTV1|nr:hypothetical protein MVLG_03783 [Microbotryum lychnidis-dioicae p1A1 Lamole]|eukprot:KDE05839.1 hypothetical protein MVLG_03783 [Microbotryum lychnidis-dioicae p1A1 Lamole]